MNIIYYVSLWCMSKERENYRERDIAHGCKTKYVELLYMHGNYIIIVLNYNACIINNCENRHNHSFYKPLISLKTTSL